MYLLKKDELKELINKNANTYVTIYLSTHDSGKEIRQDPIRLKNLLKKAEEQLRKNDIPETQIEKILKPAYDLIPNGDFWSKGDQGLALFLSDTYSKILKLPEKFTEVVTVNSRFHLKQLLPFFTNDKRFFVIAVSENDVRVIKCTKYSCEKITIDGMPTSMKDALSYIDETSTGRDIPYKGTGKNKGNTNILSGGKGGNEELDNRRKYQYFRELNKYFSEFFREDIAPVIVATTEENYPFFKEAVDTPNILDDFIKGNPEGLGTKELHSKALTYAEKYFRKREQDAIDKYMELYGTNNAIHNIQDALEFAYEGRIQTLLVSKNKEKWGRFDESTLGIEEHKEQKADDEDLIDLAAFYTIKNEGKVIVLDEDRMPKRMEVAGILRY